ncbi:Uncharacterised protein [[Ruminococcus] torques]|uniref:Uncharacterized protein n=1 Tax=[Ruminococcus] torques TaxID=33039 RepID=A0A174ZSD1_9FIRM|nr:Uncharacterised protein [[Ruminococcus] torques]
MLNSNISNESAQGFGEWLRESNYAFIYKTMAGIFNTVEPWIDEKIINEMLKDVTEIDRHITEFFLLGYAKDKKLLKKILGDRNLEFLCETGFASDVEGLIEPQGFVILPVDDLFLIVSLPSCYSNAKKRIFYSYFLVNLFQSLVIATFYTDLYMQIIIRFNHIKQCLIP